MQFATPNLLEQLLQVARTLPKDQLTEVLDFADYLQQRRLAEGHPARGSVAALLSHTGAFQFAPGELDQLTADLTHLRDLDREPHA